jgi:hypothetical protein
LISRSPDSRPEKSTLGPDTEPRSSNEDRIMSTSPGQMMNGSPPAAGSVWQAGCAGNWWTQRREASLNWLALGLLLAAWNASEDAQEVPTAQRPNALRGYSSVSVRAATLHAEEWRREFLSKGHKSVNVL